MHIRRYRRGDVPLMVRTLKTALKDYHYGTMYYDERKVSALLVGNEFNIAFFCNVLTNDKDEPVGALSASAVPYMTSNDLYAQDHIFFILPEYRSLKSATALVASYKAWAVERKVRDARLSQSTGFKMEKYAKFIQRMGFSQIGTVNRMEI